MGLENIPVSTVPAVKRYLFNKFSNLLLPQQDRGLVVCYDMPGTYRPDDIIAVGSVFERLARPWRMIGSGERHWLKEDYELEIAVDVFRGGDRQQIDAFDRAWQILGRIEQVVREDPSLGGLVIQASPSYTRDSSSWEKEHKGWLVTIESRIAISAEV